MIRFSFKLSCAAWSLVCSPVGDNRTSPEVRNETAISRVAKLARKKLEDGTFHSKRKTVPKVFKLVFRNPSQFSPLDGVFNLEFCDFFGLKTIFFNINSN